MKRVRLLLLLLLACHIGVSPMEPAATPLPPIADGAGGWYVVLAPVSVQNEVSNLGGQHLTLRVLDRVPSEPQWIHLGGHGEGVSVTCSDRFVAHITTLTPPIRVAAPAPSRDSPREFHTPDPGIGNHLPAYDGALAAITRIAPTDNLAARLALAARWGLTTTASDQRIAGSRDAAEIFRLGGPDLYCETSVW